MFFAGPACLHQGLPRELEEAPLGRQMIRHGGQRLFIYAGGRSSITPVSCTHSKHLQRPAFSFTMSLSRSSRTRPGLPVEKAQRFRDKVAFHSYTIWLFTASDLKTIIFPSTIFAIFNAFAAESYGITSSDVSLQPRAILSRTPLVLFWVWINLLPFVIDNQRHYTAIAEDAVNKPWRVMPSGRLSQSQAKRLMLSLYPLAVLSSFALGGIRQSLMMLLLGYWYNNCGGSDSNSVTRNFINALGFLSFIWGAMDVVVASNLPSTPALVGWMAIIGAIVFSTVTTQDFPDQVGDKLRQRRTLPLEIGDVSARVITSTTMLMCTFVCAWYWGFSVASIPVIAVGLTMSWRQLALRSEAQDKITLNCWTFWMVLIYVLPLFSTLNA